MQRYYNEKIFLKTKNNYSPKKAFILLSQDSNENLEQEIISQIEPNLKLINTNNIEVFTLKNTDKNKYSNFEA